MTSSSGGIEELNYSNNVGHFVLRIGSPARVGPDLAIERVRSPQHHVNSPSGTWKVRFRVLNMGPHAGGSAGSSVVAAYLSSDGTHSADDRLLARSRIGAIAPGAYREGTIDVDVPGGYPDGEYWQVLLVADADNAVAELNESANTNSFWLHIGTPSRALPDLVVEALASPKQHTVNPGDSWSINFRVHNMGQGPATTSSKAKVYLSSDRSVSADDVVLAEVNVPPLAQGVYQRIEKRITLPSGPADGYYYVLVEANSR